MATAKRNSRTAQQKSRPLWLKLLIAILLLALLGFAIARATMVDRARAGVAVGARVACSCHFLAGRDIEQCRDDFEPGMEIVMLSVDPEAKSVTAYVPLMASATASYSEGPGCVLEPWDD